MSRAIFSDPKNLERRRTKKAPREQQNEATIRNLCIQGERRKKAINMVLHRLVVLYGVGGLSDVGRHAVQAALARSDVEHVTVLTQQPELLQEANWKCGCPEPHSISEADQKHLTVVPVDSWKKDDITAHFVGATAVVSCLGNRQPLTFHWVSCEGNRAVIKAVKKTANLKRVVVCTSVGIEEDWPPMEYFAPGKIILGGIFMTLGYRMFRDLTCMERSYKATAADEVDYLFVRPVGIGEDVLPVNKWVLQKEKYKDNVGMNMAKLDVARYMVEEAIQPTRHREAVVIGPGPDEEEGEKAES